MKKQRYIPFIYLIIGVVILLFLELFPHLFYSTSFNIKAFNAVLHQKETIALNKLNELKKEQDNFSSFKNFNSFEEQGISFYVLKDDNIVFWTSATTPIDSLSKFSDDEGIVHLKNEGEGFTNWQRLFLITLWPIYSFLFWYTFWKTWFASKK